MWSSDTFLVLTSMPSYRAKVFVIYKKRTEDIVFCLPLLSG